MKYKVVCDVIRADTETINGRIYPKHVLEKFVEQCNANGDIFVTPEFDGSFISLEKVIGRATDFEMTPSGTVAATLEFLPTIFPEGVDVSSLLDCSNFSPMVIGTVDEKGVIQDDAKVAYFALTPKELK